MTTTVPEQCTREGQFGRHNTSTINDVPRSCNDGAISDEDAMLEVNKLRRDCVIGRFGRKRASILKMRTRRGAGEFYARP